MTALNLYGLKTCDTCKRAMRSLDDAGVGYEFHDVRGGDVTVGTVARWADKAGWETLLNKNSTTWRSLPENEKADLDSKKAVKLMAEHPTVIKRPIIERGATEVWVGWSKEVEDELTAKSKRRS